MYAGSWDVVAIIPEAAVVKEVGEHVVASLRYRCYAQSAASFYRARYNDLAPILSGDLRLGEIREHAVGSELGWLIHGARSMPGAVTVHLGYELSLLDYLLLGADTTVAHVSNAGVTWEY